MDAYAQRQSQTATNDLIESVAQSPRLFQYVTDLLVELCSVDTSPRVDVIGLAHAEQRTFDIIERELSDLATLPVSHRRVPINPGIAGHLAFTPLYYTTTAQCPGGLDVRHCYEGRSNLIVSVDGDRRHRCGVNQAVNVHVDVVAPYFPPRVEANAVYGRGACDDKGNVVALVASLKLLHQALQTTGVRLNRSLTCMFVIDEETGGNGSLSCVIDRELKKRYDSVLVLECTGSRLHPGNRGCVWYRVDGYHKNVNLFEASAFIVEELESEGRAIRAESEHHLFPHRPVQTSHGIIGSSGEHPSRINGEVCVKLELDSGSLSEKAVALINEAICEGLSEYVSIYGDKSLDLPGEVGSAKVKRHYDFEASEQAASLHVYGATGHMGAIQENDNAITKMASMVRSLVGRREAIDIAAGGRMSLSLEGWSDASHLVMEGGQGFLPSHTLREIERRLRDAVTRGTERYFNLMKVNVDPGDVISVTYNKLHNDAYACPVDSQDIANALSAAEAAGIGTQQPLVGWDASCDARLFACEYPEMPVITVGAGMLEHAHSDREHMKIPDVLRMAVFLTDFILRQTGTDVPS